MANIKLTLPGEPFTKQIVTFTAPCDCDKVTDGIVINGKTYTICDAMGNKIPGTGGVWCSGAQISVVLDCENKKAYLQNGTPTGFVSKSGDTMNVGAKLNFKASDGTGFGIKYVTQGTNITASNDIENENSDRYVLRFCPPNLKNPAEALRMAEVKDGKTKWATILHTGNMDALLGGFAKVVTGSYVGTGTYGENNPTSIAFEGTPKFVAIHGEYTWTDTTGASFNDYAGATWVHGSGWMLHSISHLELPAILTDNTLKWYYPSNIDDRAAGWQLNDNGRTYHYFAIY